MIRTYTPSQIADGLLAGDLVRETEFVLALEIERLRAFEAAHRQLQAALDAAIRERDEARAEVERLRASLKPFAQLYLWPDDLGEDMATLLRSEDHWCEATNEDADSDVFIKRRYIRAARAALKEKP